MFKIQKIVRSKYIFVNDTNEPINGYILINSDKFSDIKSIDSVPENFLTNFSEYEYFDYENLYIFPGLIDLNVHLSLKYDENWLDTENITKMAIKGGITTIIDNPILSNFKDKDDEISEIKDKHSLLSNKLYSDCGFFSFLSPNNYKSSYNKELQECGVLGFKGYMAPCIDPKMPYFTRKDLNDLKTYFKANPNNNLYIFHDEMASERDLFLCSPCRFLQKEKRIDLNYKIGETSDFGGGFHGDMAENFDSGEEEKDNVLDLEVAMINTKELDSPTTASLKLNAKIISKTEQEKFVAEQEASQYNNSEEKKVIMEEYNHSEDKWVEDDSELDLSEKISDDFSEIQEENTDGKMLSCPTFHRPTSSVSFSNSHFKDVMKKITVTTLDIVPTKAILNFDMEVNSSKENINPPEGIVDSNPRYHSRSPSKKQSDLMLRRKKGSSILETENHHLNNIKTFFEKKKEEEKKKVQNYFSIISNHPNCWENDGVKFIIKTFQKNHTSRVLISNLSTAKLAFDIRDQKKESPNMKIFSDISVPYLFFCSDMIHSGQTKFKNSPPIREKQDLVNSVQSLKLGVFDCVSSYHLQVPTEYKNIENGNFRRAFSGNSCIGYNLQAVWTRLFSREKMKLPKDYNKNVLDNVFKMLVKVLCSNPAKILEIHKKKGEIKVGYDADFVVWDPFKVIKVKEEDIFLRYPKMFLFRGMKLYGIVVSSFLRGDQVYLNENGKNTFVKKGKILQK